MSADIETRLKTSLFELNLILKTAKDSHCDLGKMINSMKATESHDDSILLILDQLKNIPSEQGSFISGLNSTCSSYSKKNSEHPKGKTENTDADLKRCLKTIEKIKIMSEELEDECKNNKVCPDNVKKIAEYQKNYIQKKLGKLRNSAKNSCEKDCEYGGKGEGMKQLEVQVKGLKGEIQKFYSVFRGSNAIMDQSFFSTVNKVSDKFFEFQHRLDRLGGLISKLKSSEFLSTWVQVKNYQQHFNIHCAVNCAENEKILMIMNELLKSARAPVINPKVDLTINLENESTYNELSTKTEELLLTNLNLKSDILKLEGDQKKIRKLEKELNEYKEKCEFLEKVNKELSNKKKEDSDDDSLDLDCSNIKDAIEIQELRAALRSLSERYEQEKEILIKDIIESRQDMETQIFRLQNEKNYTEVKLKDTEKLVNEMNREKERLESIIISLKKEIDKIKDSKIIDSRTPGSRRGSSELQGSGDFELTESIDKFQSNSNDLYEVLQEELSVICSNLQENGLIIDESSTVQILKKSSEFLIGIKKILQSETSSLPEPINLSMILTDLLKKLKSQASELFQTIQEKDRKLEEKEKKIQDLLKNENYEIRTEPSPRLSTKTFEANTTRQQQIEKSKLQSKKHEIHLHKEQIALLKKNIRDLQSELERACKLDIMSIKEIWLNLAKEIPLLSKSTEECIELFMRKLGFSNKDLAALTIERKNKKGKHKFGLF